MNGRLMTGLQLHARIKVRQTVPNVDEIRELSPDAVGEMEREWCDLLKQRQRKIMNAFDMENAEETHEYIDDEYFREPNFTYIWREVLHHVDSYDLFTLRCVSKNFKELADNVLRRQLDVITLNEYSTSLLQINHLLHFHTNVKTLALESITVDSRVLMLLCKNRLPCLNTLYLSNFKPFDVSSVQLMVDCLPNVKFLEIDNQSISEKELCMFVASFQNVEHLTLNGCNIGHSLHLMSSNVKAILLRDVICREMDSFCLIKGGQLHSFEYSMSWYCEDDQIVFERVATHMVNLKNFSFRSCIELKLKTLENLTKLQTLAISVPTFSFEKAETVSLPLTNVAELALNVSTVLDEDLSSFLSLFPNLKHLLIVKHYTTSILSETINYIAESNIETLTLEFVDKLDVKTRVVEENEVDLIETINQELFRLFEVSSSKSFYLDFMYPTDHRLICKRLSSIAHENELKQFNIYIWTFQEEDDHENCPKNLKIRYRETTRGFPFKDIMPFYD